MQENGSSTLKKVGQCLYRNKHGTYYALIKVRGKQIKRSLKTADSQLAKRRLVNFRKDAGKLSSEGRSLTVDDVARLWLRSIQPELKSSSFSRREFAWKQLKPFFRGRLLREVGVRDFDSWKSERGKSLSARSYNLEVETLRKIFEYGKEVLGIIMRNPVETLKRRKLPKREILIPSKGQFQALLKILRTQKRAVEAANLVEFLAYSGLRLGEATSVCWRDVNFELKTMIVKGGEEGTKNHEVRVIPLFQPLERLLRMLGEPMASEDKIFKIESAKKSLGSACKNAGIPHFSHHSMRHFFCSNAIEAGVDFMTIAKWLGHKDNGILVTSTYGHLRNEHSAAMAKRITFDAAVAISPG